MTATLEQQDMDLVPPAVRRKIEEMSKFTTPDPDAIAGTSAPAAPTPAPEEGTEEAPAGTPEPAPESAPAPAPAEGTSPAAPAPAAPQTFAEVATEEMTKEQRYKIMEGMQKAIGKELRMARADANALRGEVEALKAQVSARPAAPVATAPATEPAGTDSDLEEVNEAFGEKSLQGLVKFLRTKGFVVSQDLQKVTEQVGHVSKTVAMTAQESFESSMDDFTNGQWRKINEDPRFIEYMGEEEGRSGRTRVQIAQDYLSARNAPKLAQFFVDFMSEAGSAPAAPVNKPVVLDKKKFAAPKATSVAAPPLTDDNKPMVKTSEFAKLEADLRAGKYTSNDPEQQKKLTAAFEAEQARLNEAQRTGRMIRG